MKSLSSTATSLGRLARKHLFGVAPTIRIPPQPESQAEYLERAMRLFKDPRCQVYFDTSFLMWLTTIGGQARKDFFSWLRATCPGRYVVPVWAAHEFHRHHGEGTLLDNLGDSVKKLEAAGRSIYEDLRPFMDEPLPNGHRDPKKQQLDAVMVMNTVDSLAKAIKSWGKTYDKHALEVIDFINEFGARRSGVFEHVADVQSVGANRYENRIPPGFKDRNKKDRKSDSGDGKSAVEGSNKWGDLILWREALHLAKAARARRIILVTNDKKNDWEISKSEGVTLDEDLKKIRDDWSVPSAHPMLLYEAGNSCGADDVLLIDSKNLGALLLKATGGDASGFIDVAIVPPPPKPDTPKQAQKKAGREAMESRNQALQAQSAEAGAKFSDPSGIAFVPSRLRRALDASHAAPKSNSVTELLEACSHAWHQHQSAFDVIVKNQFVGFDTEDLVTFARALHDKSIQEVMGTPEPIGDLIGQLHAFPLGVANCLYCGFLASMYLRPGTQQLRPLPAQLTADALLALQSAPFAASPILALAALFNNIRQSPVYVPSPKAPVVPFELLSDANEAGSVLTGVRLNGYEVFSETQSVPDLNLRSLLGKESAVVEEIARMACRVFSVPYDQVRIADPSDDPLQLIPTAGFDRKSLDTGEDE